MIYTSSVELCDVLLSSVRQHEHQAQTNIILCGLETHFTKTLLLLALAGGNYTQSPLSGSYLVTANMIIPNHSLRLWKQSLSWFAGLIGPDPLSLLAINQSGKIQRRNSLSCEPSQNSPTPTQSLWAYILSKALRSQGFVSAQQSQTWFFFYKSILALRLV